MGLKQSGQGTVEYILLLTVAVSLVLTFYRSDTFKKFFGPQGSIGRSIKAQTEFGYRHALLDVTSPSPAPSRSIQGHPSYYSDKEGETRFFGPSDPYP